LRIPYNSLLLGSISSLGLEKRSIISKQGIQGFTPNEDINLFDNKINKITLLTSNANRPVLTIFSPPRPPPNK